MNDDTITLFDFLIELATNTALQHALGQLKSTDDILKFLMDGDGLGDYTGGSVLSEMDAAVAARGYMSKASKQELKKRVLNQTGFFLIEDNFSIVYQLTGTVEKFPENPNPHEPYQDGCITAAANKDVVFQQPDGLKQPDDKAPVTVQHLNHNTARTIPIRTGEGDTVAPYLQRYLTGEIKADQPTDEESC